MEKHEYKEILSNLTFEDRRELLEYIEKRKFPFRNELKTDHITLEISGYRVTAINWNTLNYIIESLEELNEYAR